MSNDGSLFRKMMLVSFIGFLATNGKLLGALLGACAAILIEVGLTVGAAWERNRGKNRDA